MSPLIVAWSMCAGACAVIGLTQIFLWASERDRAVYLLSATMSLAAAAVALVELALMKSQDIERYGRLLQWENLTVFALLVALVWFVYLRLGSRRTWLAVLITFLWCVTLVINFASPYSIVFSEITRLDVHTTGWGEPYAIASGQLNPWVLVPNVASLLILGYVADAGAQAWRAGERRRAVLVGGGIILFMLLAGIHAPLVDAGVLRAPYMISFAFLAIVLALAYELADSARRASVLERQRAEALGDAREAREELERLGRASLLGELVAGIAHELNQPLAAILSNSQAARRLLAVPSPDLEELRAIVEDVVRDDKRASEVIHRLRGLLQKHASHRERVSMAALVRETTDLMHAELQENRVRLALDSGDPTLTVDADRVGVQQVVLNLLSNAIRALREVPTADRRLRVVLGQHDDKMCLSVADRGPGIPSHVLPHLFEPFYTSNTGSFGMGLAICKRIVEAQGGTIEARNPTGGGAEFRVTLPMAKRDA